MKRSLLEVSSSTSPLSKEEEEHSLEVLNNTTIITNEYEPKQKKSKSNHDESIIEDNHSCNTRVILIDLMERKTINNSITQFSNNNSDEEEIKSLLRKLKRKLNNFDGSKLVEHSFSTNFDHSKTICGIENEEKEIFTFLYPYDVKICYNLKLLLVSGSDESKIVVFDLYDYKFIRTIELDVMPTNLCVEEWNKHSNEIIISGNDTDIYKYKLEECMKSKPKPLWICTNVNSPNGIISVYDRNNSNDNYRKETAILYVCDMFNEMISIIKSQTGQVLGNIALLSEHIHISCPWSIGMNNLGQFIISGLQNSSKHIIEIIERQYDQKKNQHEWKSIKVIENDEDKLKYPFGLVVDSISANIIVCDSLNHRIIVFKQDGTVLKVFGSKGKNDNQFSTPMGLCINKLNGELLVADSENHRICIYK